MDTMANAFDEEPNLVRACRPCWCHLDQDVEAGVGNPMRSDASAGSQHMSNSLFLVEAFFLQDCSILSYLVQSVHHIRLKLPIHFRQQP